MLTRWWMPLLLAVAVRLAVTALVAGDQQRVFNSDSYEFHEIAKTLMEEGRYSRERSEPFAAEVEITPLMPALAAVLYTVFGVRYVTVLLLHVVLAAVVVFLLWRTGPGPVGRVAAWLHALDPTSVLYAAMYTAETLFTSLLLLAVVLLASSLESDRRAILGYALAGLAAGLAVLAKPAAMYWPLLLLPGALLFRRRRGSALVALTAFSILWLATVAPWLVRNRRAIGITTISSTQEVNLLYWNVGVLEASRRGISRAAAATELRAEIERRTGRPFDSLARGERLGAARHLAIERILAHPFQYGWLHLRGAFLTLVDPGRRDLGRLQGGADWGFSILDALTRGGLSGAARALLDRPPTVLLPMVTILVWLGLLYAAAVRGLWRWRRSLGDHAFATLAVVTTAYLLPIGGPIGNARFRVPCLPYIAWFAAAGMSRRDTVGTSSIESCASSA